ncbi:hypothetical protein BDW22DRAFT_1030279 [Trametopsis cervina]|nr:hypothetical protein BDW22DRAFT_1030279 [Trametopsis cervina]
MSLLRVLQRQPPLLTACWRTSRWYASSAKGGKAAPAKPASPPPATVLKPKALADGESASHNLRHTSRTGH